MGKTRRSVAILATVCLGAGFGLVPAIAGTAAASGGYSCVNNGGGNVTCTFTGTNVAFIVPPSVSTIHVELIGGQGGNATTDGTTPGVGGAGADVTANLAVVPGQTLYEYVGGDGGLASQNSPGAGGVNGGGNGGTAPLPPSQEQVGAGGGGSSDVRTSNVLPLTGNASDPRLVVAGGGGGAVWGANNGGNASGTAGANGGNYDTYQIYNECNIAWAGTGGGGGGQSNAGGTPGAAAGVGSAGAAGSAGNGAAGNVAGGGGGGGWFGGGSGGFGEDPPPPPRKYCGAGGGAGSSAVNSNGGVTVSGPTYAQAPLNTTPTIVFTYTITATSISYQALHDTVSHGWTHISWKSVTPVAGYNVFKGHTQLNKQLIRSHTARYSFMVHQVVRHPIIRALVLH